MIRLSQILALSLGLSPVAAVAGIPVIENIVASHGDFGWRFEVTVSHGDEGWEHYADSWEIQSQEGEVIATREVMHPHVTEQPFNRSLSGVMVPGGTRVVVLIARRWVLG